MNPPNSIQRSNLQTLLWNLETHEAEASPGFFTWDEVCELLHITANEEIFGYGFFSKYLGVWPNFVYLNFGTLPNRSVSCGALTYADIHCAFAAALAGLDTDIPVGA